MPKEKCCLKGNLYCFLPPPCSAYNQHTIFGFRLDVGQNGISGAMRAYLSVHLEISSGNQNFLFIIFTYLCFQGVWFYLQATGGLGVRRNKFCHWMLKAVSLQKVHFARRTSCYKLQIWALHIFPLGGVEQNKGGDWGVDLPNVNLGGRVWWNPWTFSWIFFHLYLG